MRNLSVETVKRIIEDLETKAANAIKQAKNGDFSNFASVKAYTYAVVELQKALDDV